MHRIAASVERWFALNARDLPWRRRREGYTALVSEAMLQQTQVARVVERYEAFMLRFPTVVALAAADEQEVLAAWRGLGYYRRARNLHAAARRVVERYGGRVPSDVADLLALPGVGRYTAGAIASIVFGRAEPIVDGNVSRVIARVFGIDQPPEEPAVRDQTWQIAKRLVERADSPGAFNEGLMELGARVCRPKGPACGRCPLRRGCVAGRAGLTETIPPPKRPARREPVVHHAVAIVRPEDGRVLLVRRGERGLWAGMWQVPTVEHPRSLRPASVIARLGLTAAGDGRARMVAGCRRIGGFRHETTHRRIDFQVFLASPAIRIEGEWRDPAAVGDDLPLSNAQRRVLSVVAGLDSRSQD